LFENLRIGVKLKGRTRVIVDDVHSGWKSTVTCVEFEEQIDKCIRDNRKISIDEITSYICITVVERNIAKIY